jgi:hypothetical protein
MLLVGDYLIRQHVLHPKGFGSMVFLEVEPRSVGVASAEGLRDLERITLAEGLRDRDTGRVPF